MTTKPVLEMNDMEFDAAVRAFSHRAHLAQRKAEEDAFMANFLARNPDLKPKAAEPTDPPATPDPVVEPPTPPTSTSSTAHATTACAAAGEVGAGYDRCRVGASDRPHQLYRPTAITGETNA